jgi:hypothetical protein
MSAYHIATPGEWLTATKSNLMVLGCCDCRLVHIVHFRKHKGRFQIRCWRNARRTAAARRKTLVAIQRGVVCG